MVLAEKLPCDEIAGDDGLILVQVRLWDDTVKLVEVEGFWDAVSIDDLVQEDFLEKGLLNVFLIVHGIDWADGIDQIATINVVGVFVHVVDIWDNTVSEDFVQEDFLEESILGDFSVVDGIDWTNSVDQIATVDVVGVFVQVVDIWDNTVTEDFVQEDFLDESILCDFSVVDGVDWANGIDQITTINVVGVSVGVVDFWDDTVTEDFVQEDFLEENILGDFVVVGGINDGLANGVDDFDGQDGLLNVVNVVNDVFDFSGDWVNSLDERCFLNWGLDLDVSLDFQNFWLVHKEVLEDLVHDMTILNMVDIQWEVLVVSDNVVQTQVLFVFNTGCWDGIVNDWVDELVEQVR